MIELKYSKQFHDGLRFGVMGNAAGIYTTAQMEATDTEMLSFNFSGADVFLLILLQPNLANCTIDIFRSDYTLSNCLDGATVRDIFGTQLSTVANSQCVIPKNIVIAGFQIGCNDITLKISAS